MVLCLLYTMYRAACLIVSWVVAMVLGLLYKRFLVGAKGWEQVPLIGWYREFGNLEAVSQLSVYQACIMLGVRLYICRMAVTWCVDQSSEESLNM